MRTKHAKSIRQGLIIARAYVRGNREDNLELVLTYMWGVHRLEGLSLLAFNRTYRKRWKRYS